MNRVYRLIWSEPRNAWVVAPELARAKGKRRSRRMSAGLAAVLLALAAPELFAADLAPGALPTGGTVVAGQAGITSSGTRMDITQGSQRALINWLGFDIGSAAQVNFAQPNAAAVILNRVSGPTASRIEGQLNANGQVFLVNPNGVLFGGGARVNVGALVASTLNIRDDDFLAGNYSFSGSGGSIENRGTISAAPGGYLAFIAPKITNSGTVSARQGTVAMGAGERVTLNFSGDRLVALSVAAQTLDTLITNSQAIRAEGGAILLTAAGADTVTRGVINNSGVLEASSLNAQGGRIVLSAGGDITLAPGSTLSANGAQGGAIELQAKSGTALVEGLVKARGDAGIGGTIELLGERVGLINAARVDASGAAGGGTVLVGGDYQGKNAEVQNAQRTYVSPGATIKADAIERGDGGKVVVWADGDTQYYGNISAKGGNSGGNGGFVEVSGKGFLDFQGRVEARAPAGVVGTLLLDPTDVTISSLDSTPTLAFGAGCGAGIYCDTTTTPSNLNVTTLTTQLGLSDVTVSTASALADNGDITVQNLINYNSGFSLSLTASRNITINAGSGIANAGLGALNLNAGGAGSVAINENVSAGGGTITIHGGSGGVSLANTKSVNASNGLLAIDAGGGAVDFGTGTLSTSNATASAIGVTNATTLALGKVELTGGGTLTVSHSGAGSQNAGTTISGTGGLVKLGTGTMTLSGSNTYIGSTTINSGILSIQNSDALGNASNTSATTVASGAVLQMSNNITTTNGGTLILNGTGTGLGALVNVGGSNTWNSDVRLNSDATIYSSTPGTTLTIGNAACSNLFAIGSNTVTIGGLGNTWFNSNVGVAGDTGGLVKNSSGTATLYGYNTFYTGATTVNAGTLNLVVGPFAPGWYGINGPLMIGTGPANPALAGAVNVNIQSDSYGNQISPTSAVTINSDGALNVGSSTSLGALTLNGGQLNIWGGVTVTATGNVASNANSAHQTSLISGSMLNLNTGNFSVARDAILASDLTISSAIGGTDITKTGNGTLTLSGANIYTGTTNINDGMLVASNATALGAPEAGTTIANGATLSIANGIAIGSETLSLSGAGVGANGALTVTSGTGSLAGPVTLEASTSIGGNGSLTLSGGVNDIAAGTSTLTQVGSGTLTFSNAVGAINALAAVTTSAGQTTAIDGGAVRTTGSQTYGGSVTLGAPTVLTTTNSNITVAGAVNAGGNTLTLAAGTGDASLANVGNNFATVTVTSGKNISLADIDAINLGASNVTGMLRISANGDIKQSGALSVTGASSFTTNVAGAHILLNNSSNSFAGNVTASTTGAGSDADIRASGGLTFGASSVGGSFTGVATGNLTLNGNIGAGASGDAIVLAARANFINAGNFSLTPGTGHWLVYSTNPGSDTRGAPLLAAYDFKQYNAAFGGPVLGAGDGFLYSVAPIIAPGLVGAVGKIYDGNNSATLGAANYTLSGAIDGDTVILNNSAAGTFDDKNVGTGKTVTATGILISSASNGVNPVFGYQLGSGSATANIGTITPAALALNAVTDTKVYDGGTASAGAVAKVGLQDSDTVTSLTQSYANKNVLGLNGSTLNVNAGYAVNDGNGGGNYTVTQNSATGTITATNLTITADDKFKLTGKPNPPFTATYAGLVGSETAADLNGALAYSTPANITSPAGAYAISPFGQTSSNYVIAYVDGALQVIAGPAVPNFIPVALVGQQAIAARFSDLAFVQCILPVVRHASNCDSSAVRIIAGGLRPVTVESAHAPDHLSNDISRLLIDFTNLLHPSAEFAPNNYPISLSVVRQQ